MKDCCKIWIDDECFPKEKVAGKWTELLNCSKCDTLYSVGFEEIAVLGDDGKSEWALISVDPV